MQKFNVWKSTMTNSYYPMELDWLPKFDGYVLMGTIEAKDCVEAMNFILDGKIKF
jgi:hypothetical protein